MGNLYSPTTVQWVIFDQPYTDTDLKIDTKLIQQYQVLSNAWFKLDSTFVHQIHTCVIDSVYTCCSNLIGPEFVYILRGSVDVNSQEDQSPTIGSVHADKHWQTHVII